MSTAFHLRVPRRLIEGMLAQAAAERPNECCGLLAGRVEAGTGKVTQRYPLVNAAADPRTEYLSEPRGLFAAFRDIRERGIELLAVYHSHPTSEPMPSRKDCAQNCYPEAVHLIISLVTDPPRVRGWWVEADGFREAAWDSSD